MENLHSTLAVLNDFRSGLDFKDLTYTFLRDFEQYLREKGNAVNTIAKHMRQLRTLVNEAINQGYMHADAYPFRKYKIKQEKGIKVSNASGYSTVAVAELTIAMMLDLLRRVPQVDAACRAGGTKAGLVGNELEGKTVALVGTGHIGHRVAELVHAFGAKVIAYNGFSHKADTELIKYLPMKGMMEQADIVSLHCPVTDKSKGLINKETLSYMKPTAFLINEARGPVVVSQDLADALNSGKIAGAGIDVFENEPPLDTNHPLLHAKNTIVTPHVAFATAESMAKRAVIVFDNIDAGKILEGSDKRQ